MVLKQTSYSTHEARGTHRTASASGLTDHPNGASAAASAHQAPGGETACATHQPRARGPTAQPADDSASGCAPAAAAALLTGATHHTAAFLGRVPPRRHRSSVPVRGSPEPLRPPLLLPGEAAERGADGLPYRREGCSSAVPGN